MVDKMSMTSRAIAFLSLLHLLPGGRNKLLDRVGALTWVMAVAAVTIYPTYSMFINMFKPMLTTITGLVAAASVLFAPVLQEFFLSYDIL